MRLSGVEWPKTDRTRTRGTDLVRDGPSTFVRICHWDGRRKKLPSVFEKNSVRRPLLFLRRTDSNKIFHPPSFPRPGSTIDQFLWFPLVKSCVLNSSTCWCNSSTRLSVTSNVWSAADFSSFIFLFSASNLSHSWIWSILIDRSTRKWNGVSLTVSFLFQFQFWILDFRLGACPEHFWTYSVRFWFEQVRILASYDKVKQGHWVLNKVIPDQIRSFLVK